MRESAENHTARSGCATRKQLFPRHNLFRMSRKPHDMHSTSRPVRAINQAAIVHLDVVRFNHLLAGRSNLRIACGMADSILRAESHCVLIRRRNEVGDLLHGKGIANIKYASARIKPGKNRNLAVVGRIKRFGYRMRAEPASLAAVISWSFGHAKRRKRPWGSFIADVHEECQMRPSAVSSGTRGAMVASRRFRRDNQQVPILERGMPLESGHRFAKNRKGSVCALVG